jgi:hypothetical protein
MIVVLSVVLLSMGNVVVNANDDVKPLNIIKSTNTDDQPYQEIESDIKDDTGQKEEKEPFIMTGEHRYVLLEKLRINHPEFYLKYVKSQWKASHPWAYKLGQMPSDENFMNQKRTLRSTDEVNKNLYSQKSVPLESILASESKKKQSKKKTNPFLTAYQKENNNNNNDQNEVHSQICAQWDCPSGPGLWIGYNVTDCNADNKSKSKPTKKQKETTIVTTTAASVLSDPNPNPNENTKENPVGINPSPFVGNENLIGYCDPDQSCDLNMFFFQPANRSFPMVYWYSLCSWQPVGAYYDIQFEVFYFTDSQCQNEWAPWNGDSEEAYWPYTKCIDIDYSGLQGLKSVFWSSAPLSYAHMSINQLIVFLGLISTCLCFT